MLTNSNTHNGSESNSNNERNTNKQHRQHTSTRNDNLVVQQSLKRKLMHVIVNTASEQFGVDVDERDSMDSRIYVNPKGQVWILRPARPGGPSCRMPPLHFTKIKEIHPFGVDIDERISMDFRISVHPNGVGMDIAARPAGPAAISIPTPNREFSFYNGMACEG